MKDTYTNRDEKSVFSVILSLQIVSNIFRFYFCFHIFASVKGCIFNFVNSNVTFESEIKQTLCQKVFDWGEKVAILKYSALTYFVLDKSL